MVLFRFAFIMWSFSHRLATVASSVVW